MPQTNIDIDLVDSKAKNAATNGASLNEACEWPWDSDAGRRFKQTYFFHRAALAALAAPTAEEPTP